MQEYFEQEITAIEKELRWLKTSAVKSGATITSISKSLPYNIPLELTSSTNAAGSARFRLTVDDNANFNATLDKYFDNIVAGPYGDSRRRAVEVSYISSGVYVIRVYARGDSNDISTLERGGQATMGGTLTVCCTDNFVLEAI